MTAHPTTDTGHTVVAYLSSVLLVILLAAYAPWVLAVMAAVCASGSLWYCLSWATDDDDITETDALAGDTHLVRHAAQYGSER
jgi:hypothetical protein